jgi:hypothetical protein
MHDPCSTTRRPRCHLLALYKREHAVAVVADQPSRKRESFSHDECAPLNDIFEERADGLHPGDTIRAPYQESFGGPRRLPVAVRHQRFATVNFDCKLVIRPPKRRKRDLSHVDALATRRQPTLSARLERLCGLRKAAAQAFHDERRHLGMRAHVHS